MLAWAGASYPEAAGQLAADELSEVISFTTLNWSEAQATWCPTAFVGWFHPAGLTLNDAGAVVDGLSWRVAYESLFGEQMDALTRDQAQVEAMDHLQSALDALIEFTLTVNCANTAAREIPPPAALNKKRAAAGKEPLPAYYLLTIPGGDGDGQHADGGAGAGHRGPRAHLRRGHLRRLESGRVIWVRHTMVGAAERGIAENVYRVKPPGARAAS